MTAPSRRRFRFGLRTILVLVAVLGAACAWWVSQFRIVRERQTALQRIELHQARWREDKETPIFSMLNYGDEMQGEFDSHLPWYRRLMGDRHALKIAYFSDTADARDIRYLQELFPEAGVLPVNIPQKYRSTAPSPPPLFSHDDEP